MVDPPSDDDDGVEALMSVFERFRRARMWLSHASDEPVALCFADDDDPEDWFAVVMGSGRIEFGVSMARGLSGRRVLSARGADDASGEITSIARSVTMIGFSIDRYALLPREQREQIERAGFRLRPEASAPFVVVRRRGCDTLATADDLRLLAHATAALLDADERGLFRPEDQPVTDAWRRLQIGGTWQRPEVVVDWARPPASQPRATETQPTGTAAENPWCDVLGIAVPRLEDVAEHRRANTYTRLIVALLERGEPMTLVEVAERFEQAGIAPTPRALLSLKRCRPGRPPVFRDGDLYHVDPHDDEADLWAFRLGLRPSKATQLAAEQSGGKEAAGEDDPAPLPDDTVPLTPRELDEAWKDEHLFNWAHYVLVLAVLDAGGGSPRSPADVVAAVSARTSKHRLPDDVPAFRRRDSHVDVLGDDRWAIPEDAESWVRKARNAVRERIERVRRSPRSRSNTAALQRRREELERRRVVRYGLAPAMWEDVEGGRFDSRDIQRARILGPSPWPRPRPGPRPGDA